MPVFTVHAPIGPASGRTAERAVLVRDGFHFWAFVFGALWLAMHRLWLAALGYAIVAAALLALFGAAKVGVGTAFLGFLVLAALLGLEAASLWRWTLARRGFREVDVVVADDRDAAERRYFERLGGARRPADAPVSRGAPPPVRPVLPGDDVFGAFPRPGSAA